MEALPVAPSLQGGAHAHVRGRRTSDRRIVVVSALAIGVAVAASCAAALLSRVIALVTQLSFFGRLSVAPVSPADHHLGAAVIAVPVAGALLVGLIARYGSPAIRGHGIPEAMEQILVNESRIPARLTLLKPLSAALSIGTGGPFGAEGPIIATGGALGSLVGQVLPASPHERKVLLAAGAAAGMAATFGTPFAAALLAIELLLFEFRARSFVPVALAATAATAVRAALGDAGPMFSAVVAPPGPEAVACYVLLGAAVGVVAVGITRAVYAVEDLFARLPVHWMWWPALGGLAVGLVGLVAPRTLGVGYDNIQALLSGRLAAGAAFALAGWKLASWTVALGSGTSGGTLAPLFTVGGGLGAAAAAGLGSLLPAAGIDPRLAALVGMAATFAGASRAALTSIAFAFELTGQPAAVLPLLGGTAAATLVSRLLMRHTIMTEKIARRGIRVTGEYDVDVLEQVPVGAHAARQVRTLRADEPVASVRAWLASHASGSGHQGYPVVDRDGALVGVLTRRDVFDPAAPGDAPVGALVRRQPLTIAPDATLKEAVAAMLDADVGRLVVVERGRVAGILTRSDVLAAYRSRIAEHRPPRRRRRGARARARRVAAAARRR